MCIRDSYDDVKSVEYRSKEDALKIMKKRWGESSYLLDSLGDNPLPNSILITVDSLDSAGKVTEYAGSMDGVEDVKYYKETVEKLTKVTNFLQIAALVIMAFLIVVSAVSYTHLCRSKSGCRLRTRGSQTSTSSSKRRRKQIQPNDYCGCSYITDK